MSYPYLRYGVYGPTGEGESLPADEEAEEGKDVVIARGKKPAVRLVAVEKRPAHAKRVLGQYAGQFQYPDDFFKPLETDEELREYGFDILAAAKVLDESAS
jgi:antitoxin (DNA-binding transcriptional repressor) of toxin-antitoxin stability system